MVQFNFKILLARMGALGITGFLVALVNAYAQSHDIRQAAGSTLPGVVIGLIAGGAYDQLRYKEAKREATVSAKALGQFDWGVLLERARTVGVAGALIMFCKSYAEKSDLNQALVAAISGFVAGLFGGGVYNQLKNGEINLSDAPKP